MWKWLALKFCAHRWVTVPSKEYGAPMAWEPVRVSRITTQECAKCGKREVILWRIV